jgi:hypothetical protein
VLLPWSKTNTLIIGPDAYALNDGIKVTLFDEVIQSSSKPDWRDIVVDLETNASQLEIRKVKLIISNQFVRYLVLPWQSEIYKEKDWLYIAKTKLRKIYGTIADEWRVKVVFQAYGQPILVSAIDSEMIERLESIAVKNNWSISGIEPALFSVISKFRKQVGRSDMLLINEGRRLVAAKVENDAIVTIAIASPNMGGECEELEKLTQRNFNRMTKQNAIQVMAFSHQVLPKSFLSGATINLITPDHDCSVTHAMATLL